MWIIDDKYGRLGIFQNKSKRVFKYLFDGGKKLLLAEYFERNNRTFFFVYLQQIQFLSVFR